MKRSHLAVFALALCAACDDDSTTPGNALAAFIGTYALDPTVTVECAIPDLATLDVMIDTVEVTDASEDSLYLRVPLRISTSLTGELDSDAAAEFAVGVDGAGEFAGDAPLEAAMELGPTLLSGNGLVAIQGDFTSDDAFEAEIIGSFNVQVGNGQPTACAAVAEDVTGTRVD